MKLLSLFAVSCIAGVVPKDDEHALPQLVPRIDGQQVFNLDNEPDFEDPDSNDKVSKSGILSGLGNAEADNRWFDWDQTCTDAGERQKILTAFTSTMTLAEWASQHVQGMIDNFPKPAVDNKVNPDNQKFIFAQYPSYAQMFGGWDGRAGYVKDTLKLVADRAQSFDGRNGNKPPALRFVCNSDNHVLNANQAGPICGEGGNAAQAIAVNHWKRAKKELRTVEPRYSFETSAAIIFCPVFFDDNKFPNLATVERDVATPTLDKVDCRERILLHEYMHLDWIRDMNGKPDEIGYDRAAKFAKQSGWGATKRNPDNFAWLALYAHFNNRQKAKSGSSKDAKCESDMWPPGVKRPFKV